MSHTDLKVGDYVVHVSHGIGVFRGVEKMRSADGSMKDFIKISYAGSDVLYVPCANLDSVSKYIGPKSDGGNLKLNKLGGNEWQRTKSKARAATQEIAGELAAELGGEVASSRIGVDSGWIERERQVGQTGKTVHPQLYIACGISGAIQHQAGMEDSEFILAINTDVHCPMMQLADLGIVGDLKKIVPALTEAVKKYKASQAV